jgi:hypothetical protein
MSRALKMVLIGVTTMLIVACNLFTQIAPNSQSTAATAQAPTTQPPTLEVVVPTSTASPLPPTVEATAAPTLTPAPSDTALPAFTATATAKPVPSDTAVPALTLTTSPGLAASAALAAAVPTADATQLAMFGPTADLMGISQFYNPVGTPLQSWHGVPIMSQAIAGQEFKSDVYSYKATATLQQAVQYYTSKAASMGLPSLPMGTGYGGTGSMAYHSTTFLSHTIGIVVTSLDNDPQHVIVVIAKAP